MAEVNFPAASESPWFNPDNGVTYEFVGGAWRAISTATDLSDTYVNVSGDTMTGELILYGNPIQNLGATPKQYVDNKIINSIGNGALSIASFGSGDISTGSYTANQSGAGRVTLPQISYGDLKDKPSIPNPGNGTITVTQPGTNPQTFTVNQNNNTTIALRNDNTQVTPGNGALTIKTAGQGASATGTFTANQSTATTLTLPTIRYQDLSGTPTIPPAAGDGTITIKQPGSADQSFTVNQSGNTEINLKNDNTVPTVGNGIITIKQPGANDQTFTVNQTGNTVINLKNDNTVQAVGNGRITIKQPGLADQSFTVNQSGNTEITLKNDNTVVTPGNGSLTIKTAGEGASATGTFTANQSAGSTLTLPTIRYGDLSGRPSIPAAAGNGTITITQPGVANQTFTVNQSGNTTIALRNDDTVVTPGNGSLTIRTSGQNAAATGSFTANQSGNSTLTLPAIRWTDISGKPTTEEGLWTPEFLNDNLIFYNGQFGFYKFQGDGGVNLTGRIRWNNGGSNTNEIKIQTPFVIPAGVTACNGTGSWLEATTGLNTAFVPTMFQTESTISFIRGNIVDRNLSNNRLKHNEFGSGDLRFSIFLINANPI